MEAIRSDGLGRNAVFEQNPNGTFRDVTDAVGLNVNESSRYAQLADLTGDGNLDLIIQGTYSFPAKVYDISGNTFRDITYNFPRIYNIPNNPTKDELETDAAKDSVFGDFNNDGRVDVFLTRSRSLLKPGESSIFQGTPPQLFRNQGNDNNWIQIDLEGVESNRDGIGARVLATTPDGVTQLREQNGGMHIFAQNTKRIHFGLAQNQTIQSLVIEWPSGTRQVLNNVAVNQILKIRETGDGTLPNPGDGTTPIPNPETGDIIGTANNDNLNGTNRGDRILGGDGNDTISGFKGADTIFGEQGSDSLNGSNGNDFLDGGSNNDTLMGGEGGDTLIAGSGNDSL